jgi:hypothetical protein
MDNTVFEFDTAYNVNQKDTLRDFIIPWLDKFGFPYIILLYNQSGPGGGNPQTIVKFENEEHKNIVEKAYNNDAEISVCAITDC